VGCGHDVENPIPHYRLIDSPRFLLVSLNIEAILQESTIYRRREKLSKMIDGLALEDVYGATIERIKAQGGDKSRLGMGALMWISYAEEPLIPEQLCYALAIELGSRDFNDGNIPSITTLVACCQGLILVDKEGSTVRLIHFTLREYLSAHAHIFSSPHSAMAEVCLTYLNSQQVKALSGAHYNDRGTFFLQYCSLYWGEHAKRDLSDKVRLLALELLLEYEGHISSVILLDPEGYYMWRGPDRYLPFSGLHCASFLGIVEIVAALIGTGRCDLNGGDYSGRSPLSWAAEKGREEVMKMLLGQEEVSPDMPDNHGQTPLYYAAQSGHGGAVEILLGREEVDPDKSTNYNLSPLSCAAENGHGEVVKMLLGRAEVNPDKPGCNGQTPLSLAAGRGHGGVVEILLEMEEVNPDRPDIYGRTPLSFAAGNLLNRGRDGSPKVVKMLLGRDEVNPESIDNLGRTPLSYSADCGYGDVIKILLGRAEVNPDRADSWGRTPLSFAAQRGHETAAMILLRRKEVNPDKPDDNGETPRMLASTHPHMTWMALL